MKVSLKDRKIPLREDGYPNFKHVGIATSERWPTTEQTLRDVFTLEEIVELVNRALYQLEYQKTAHRKYQQRLRDWQAPIKDQLKVLFPGVSWVKATSEQMQVAMEAAYGKKVEMPKEEQ